MAGTIYIRLEEHEAAWLVHGVDGLGREQRGSLEDAARASAGLRVLVLAPTAHLLLTHTTLPLQNRHKLRLAVPYAIEDQLSDDVENLHFALGMRQEGGAVPVAVMARARLQAWLAGLAAAGLQANALVPDALALPLAPAEWSLLLGHEGVLLRTGHARGLALELNDIDMLLDIALQQAGEDRPTRLRVFDARGDGSVERAARAAEVHGVAVSVETCPHGELGLLARQLSGPLPLDLLQGEFSRREQLGKLWRPWRSAAALLGAALALQVGMATYDHVQLSREAEHLSQRIEEVYRRAFPDARNVVDPRKQMEDRLAALRGGGGDGFTTLLAGAAPMVNAAGAEVAGLRYKDGVLDMDLHLADLQRLDKLKQDLAGKGLGVDIQTASSRAGKVEARLQIREAR
ncbi:MAG: type II secretion system protein GspL [Thiohalomonadaceae bacterium]